MSVYSRFSNIEPSDGETGVHNDYQIIKRYYFIEHIEIRNNLAVITCTIDYWHTYRFALGGLNFGNYTPERLRNQFGFTTKYGFLTSTHRSCLTHHEPRRSRLSPDWCQYAREYSV